MLAIRRTFEVITPESAEHGDADRRGWTDAHGWEYADAPAPEIVTFRVIVEIEVPRLEPPRIEAGDGDAGRARTGERALWDPAAGAFARAGVFDRARLLAGDRIEGPAIVEQFDSTTVVAAGQTAELDGFGTLVIDTGAAR